MKCLLLWIPPIVYMVLIFTASSVPGDDLPSLVWDKAAHFLVFGGLGALFLLPLTDARVEGLTLRAASMAVALTTLYGVFDEFHQLLTPERSADWRDLVADCLGASLGVAVIYALVAIWKNVRPRSTVRD